MEEVGGSLGVVVSMTVHITDVRYNGELVELRKEFFQEEPVLMFLVIENFN